MTRKWTRQMYKLSGFTLIEILVVVAIIAILAAILFPVFARARENARRASCQSNMKQIALGVEMYVQDHDEAYPHYNNSVGGDPGWAEKIQPYLKSKQIMQCPSERYPSDSATTAPIKGYSDYWANYWIFQHTFNPVTKKSRIAFASNTILNFEGAPTAAPAGCEKGGGYSETSWVAGGAPNTCGDPPSHIRHLEGANYSFVDGHVKWLRPEKILSATTTSVCNGGASKPDGSNATFCYN